MPARVDASFCVARALSGLRRKAVNKTVVAAITSAACKRLEFSEVVILRTFNGCNQRSSRESSN
jgi:hypothetical protein